MQEPPDIERSPMSTTPDSFAIVQPPELDRLRSAKGFIFDMDGVLYLGSRLLPGVNDLFNALRLRGIPFLLATNNSTETAQSFIDRLAVMGVEVSVDNIQTSATTTRDYIRDAGDIPEDATILVVGQPALAEILQTGTSFKILADDQPPTDASVVVAGLDLEFTYEKMRRAVDAIEHGAAFIATNADDRLPNENGYQPGAGAVIAGIEKASRKSPVVIGKPQPLMMLKGVEHLGCEPGEAVMVGDRLDTDIAAASGAGLITTLVLTGVSTRADLATSDVLPDYVFADLPAMLQGFIGHG
jgi:4-nitrophenyl phosphatase